LQIDFRTASATDAALLAPWNSQLIRDEGHSNRMAVPELEVRMRGWLSGGTFRAVIFLRDSVPVGYALFGLEADSGVYLRQFFICREFRRQRIGTAAMHLLVEKILPPGARLSLVVLAQNEPGRKFWSSLGFEMHAHIMERHTTRGPTA
jgi:GNAT superfamily N-acetyltransferase